MASHLNFSRVYSNVEKSENGCRISYRGFEGNRKSLVFEIRDSETGSQFKDRVMNEYESKIINPIQNAITDHKADVDHLIDEIVSAEPDIEEGDE